MLESQRIKASLRILLAALLIGLVGAPAGAADWRLTAMRYTDFGLSLSFIDVQSIRGGNGKVEFSTLTFFNRETRKMNRVSAIVTADCPSRTYSFRQIVLFQNQERLSEWHSTAPSTAMPRSNVFDSINSACGVSTFGMHVESVESFAADYFKKWPGRRSKSA